jgi:uncharacterized membrane protein YqjE
MFNIDAMIQRLSGSARSLWTLVGGVARNRLELFEVELREQLAQAALLGVLLGVLLVLSMLGALAATAWGISAAGEEHRLYVLIGLTLAYSLAAGLGAMILFIKVSQYRDRAASAVAAVRGAVSDLEARLAGQGPAEKGGADGRPEGEAERWHSDAKS